MRSCSSAHATQALASRLCLVAILFAGLLFSLPSRSQETPAGLGAVELIANPDANLAVLDQEALLRAVFTLRTRTWPDGTPVRIFVFPEQHPAHESLCRDLLGTFPYVLRRAWDQALFAGTGLVPQVVESVEEMRRRVGETPGALGYVPVTDGALSTQELLAAPGLARTELKS